MSIQDNQPKLTKIRHLVAEALWYREGFAAAEPGKFPVLDKATLSCCCTQKIETFEHLAPARGRSC